MDLTQCIKSSQSGRLRRSLLHGFRRWSDFSEAGMLTSQGHLDANIQATNRTRWEYRIPRRILWVRPRRDVFTSSHNPSVKIQFTVTPNCRMPGDVSKLYVLVEKKTVLVNSWPISGTFSRPDFQPPVVYLYQQSLCSVLLATEENCSDLSVKYGLMLSEVWEFCTQALSK